MSPLEKIALVILVSIAIGLIIYGERSITGHWLFWVGILLVIAVFVGIPAAIVSGVNRLNL